MAPSRTSPTALKSKATSIQALLNHFTVILGSRAEDQAQASISVEASSINALHVLRDTATLLKSHTTKLSLLLITPPFTPSAILSVLEPCETQVVPAMMSGWQILANPPPNSFYGGNVVRDEICSIAKEVVSGFQTVLALVVAKTQEAKEDTGAFKKQVLSGTGVLWDACGRLVATVNLEIPGIVARKAEAFRAILDDAIEELKEWGTVGEATPDDSEDEDEDTRSDDDQENELYKDEEDEMDPLGGQLDSLPAKRTDLRILHQKTMKELRLVSTLYRAITKHRIRTLPPSSTSTTMETAIAKDTDALLDKMRSLPDQVDDLAAAFYEGNAEEADEQLHEIVTLARDMAKSVHHKLGQAATVDSSAEDTKPDVFTSWAEKWDKAVADALDESAA